MASLTFDAVMKAAFRGGFDAVTISGGAENEYVTKLETALNINTKEDAVRSLTEWGWERVISWDNDLRVPLVKALLNRANAFFVEPPPFWFDVIANPAKFDALHSELTEGDAFDTPTWALDVDHRPTEEAEQDATSYLV